MKKLGFVVVLVILCSACSTTTQFAIVPPVVPAVAPGVSEPEFLLNIGVEAIEPGANLEVFAKSSYRTIANNGTLIWTDGQKLTVPCMLNFHLPVQPNPNDKWGQADVKISQDTPKCLCERNTCRGSITLWLRDASTGQTLPGPHTSMTIEWDESGDISKQKLTWHN
jgi:hypothetical protein